MLDTDTKARIDSARDILVGKVPDPKSQVEQITIALIYKFMNDMDRQSEDLDGKATFFSGEFKRYAWSHLLDNRLGGHERLLLYREGVEKMNENKNIPQLFRDIFRGVFLPYRDPETLNLFLKEINGFTYDHSERLGDAFEYLLSVMDSQGDAGQFRTPRHIIDFIVRVIDPQKHETILDPACGTAGFLISAYKHILANNTKVRPGDRLSADERGRLMTSFCGYDISPDMVRLSRVNLYLHGFANPRIHEYDTLTSEERWDERYDLIMANPPFMTPKGGIRPHNRFSITAKRSEVLFVDYIAEHLNPNGRAGVIVPEGIIFQSQNAYKKLRRMLVENYLWAVVSLPAGVFNPYSGVKTSILFLDRNLAKRTDEVLFVKVENDGFDLGAQRRPIEPNDLPDALKAVETWKKVQKAPKETIAHAVSRKRLLESPDCNFSGDRYRPIIARGSGKWPVLKVGDVCTQILSGGTPSTKVSGYWKGDIPWITSADIQGLKEVRPRKHITREAIKHSATNLIPADNVVVVTRVGLGKILLNPFDLCISQDSQGLVVDRNRISPAYLAYVLSREVLKFKENSRGSTIQGVVKSQLAELEIPLPPLAEQQRIVAELDGYRQIIEGARQVIANYKPTIKLDPTWPRARLGDVTQVNRSSVDPAERYGEAEFVYIDISSVENEIGKISFAGRVRGHAAPSRARRVVMKGDVLLSTVRPNLKAFAYFDEGPENVVASTGFAVLTPHPNKVLGRFVWHLLFEEQVLSQMLRHMGKGSYPSINQSDVESLEVPIPPLSIQHQIVTELEAERAIVESNRKLIEIFEGKIKAKLDEIWGAV